MATTERFVPRVPTEQIVAPWAPPAGADLWTASILAAAYTANGTRAPRTVRAGVAGPTIEQFRARIGSAPTNAVPKPPPALRSASEWVRQRGGTPNVPRARLTRQQLFTMVGERLAQQARGHEAQLDAYLRHLETAFRVARIDTVEAQAVYLAHAAGEAGFVRLTEGQRHAFVDDPAQIEITREAAGPVRYRGSANVDPIRALDPARNPTYENTFIGRGPVQVTHEFNYVRTLLYMEELAKKANAADAALLWSAVAAIKRDPRQAAHPRFSFLFSAVYMHQAGGVRAAAALPGTTPTFSGQDAASSWVAGGGFHIHANHAAATAALARARAGGDAAAIAQAQARFNEWAGHKSRADIKAATYRRAVAVLGPAAASAGARHTAVSDDAPLAEWQMVGQLAATGGQTPIVVADQPEYSSTTLDDALQHALHRGTASWVLRGDLLRAAQFDCLRCRRVVRTGGADVIDADLPACAAVLFDGAVYVPADPVAPATRWVRLPRAAEFYALSAADRTAQRNDWIAALAAANPRISIAGITVNRSWLNTRSMPALRMLLAHFAASVLRVRAVHEPARRFSGGVVNGRTLPLLRYPLQEPDCYLPVIAAREGRLEAINAYDLGAGISLGPIQFNLQRALVIRLLDSFRARDPVLFRTTLGTGPQTFTTAVHDGHTDLSIGNGAAALTLHGRAADQRRNVAWFQANRADPAADDFASIDAAHRRALAARFRDAVAWPHVQELIIRTSSEYLDPGLTLIHEAANGIPPLDPANPDRDLFILKALLLSAYVRYSACLAPLLQTLRRWTTPADKLAHIYDALNDAGIAWGACNAQRRGRLRTRLQAQQPHAARVHDVIGRLRQARAQQATEAVEALLEQTSDPFACTAPLRLAHALIDAITETRRRAGAQFAISSPVCNPPAACPAALRAAHNGGNATHLVDLTRNAARLAEQAGLWGLDLHTLRSTAAKLRASVRTVQPGAPFGGLDWIGLRRGTGRQVHVAVPANPDARRVEAVVEGETWHNLAFAAAARRMPFFLLVKRRYSEASLHRQWGHATVIDWTLNLVAFYAGTGAFLGVGDISHMLGEEMTDHGSHRRGRDVDLYVTDLVNPSTGIPEAYFCTGQNTATMRLQPLAPPQSQAHDFGAAGAALAGARLDEIRRRFATIVAWCLLSWPRLNACVWHGVSWVLADAQAIATAAMNNWQTAWGPAPAAAPPTAAATLARKLIGHGHAAYGAGRGWPLHQDHLHIRLDI